MIPDDIIKPELGINRFWPYEKFEFAFSVDLIKGNFVQPDCPVSFVSYSAAKIIIYLVNEKFFVIVVDFL